MATTTTTIMANSIREDLIDVITNHSPDDTVALTNFGRAKATAITHEWLMDSYSSGAANAQSESATASAATITAPSRGTNYIQVLAKWFGITDALEAVSKAGRKSEIKYQTAKHMKELALDIDYALINNATASNSDPRTMKGLYGWITTNTYDFGGSNATSNLLTETLIVDEMQACFEAGVKPDLIIAPPYQKRKISDFDGSNRITVNTTAEAKKVVNVVDYYETDFGLCQVLPSTNVHQQTAHYDSLYILKKDLWKTAWLKQIKVEKLAKQGLSTTVQLSAYCTLEARGESGNAAIHRLYDGG